MELVPNRRRRKPRMDQLALPVLASVDRQRKVKELQRRIDQMQQARKRHPSR